MIEVWHTTNENFAAGIVGEPVPFPGGYVKVAEVFTNELEEAFAATNTIDQAWWLNDNVKALGGPVQRSTSVGDVLVYNGKAFRCAGAGWKEIPLAPVTDEELRELIRKKATVSAIFRKTRDGVGLAVAKEYVIKLRDEMGA